MYNQHYYFELIDLSKVIICDCFVVWYHPNKLIHINSIILLRNTLNMKNIKSS